MSKRVNLVKIFPFFLIVSLLVAIIANIVSPLNLKLSILVLIGLIALLIFLPKIRQWSECLSAKTVTKVIATSLLIILLIQIFVLLVLPITVYHDPFRVLYQAELLSRDIFRWDDTTYFWRYPNNVPIAYFLSLWLRLTNVLGLTTNFSVHLLSLLLLDTFIVVSIQATRRLSQNNFLPLGLTFSYLISPFAYTYFLQVMYTDLPVMLVLLLSFLILQRWATFSLRQKAFAGVALFILVLVGQMIKPSLLLFGVASLFVLAIMLLLFLTKKVKPTLLLPLIVILFSFGVSFPATNALDAQVNFTNNVHYELPTTHWIWMSYKPQGTGQFNGDDVRKMNEVPDIALRKTYLNNAIPERLKKLGPAGIVGRWLLKMGIFFNVGTLQEAYSGGFRSAPGWYQCIAPWLNKLGTILMRIFYLMIYLTAFSSAVRLWRAKTSKFEPLRYLILITALGYIAFHTLIWETGNRYGQAVLPLLLLFNALSAQAPQSEQRQPSRLRAFLEKKRTATWPALAAISVVGLFFVMFGKNISNDTRRTVVAAQRSQLSLQYHAKTTQIDPGSTVQQTVNLNGKVGVFKVFTPRQQNLQVYLVDLSDGVKFPLKREKESNVIRRNLKPGRYRIVIKNNLAVAQELEVVRMINYRLADYPLEVDKLKQPHESLVYKALSPLGDYQSLIFNDHRQK